jgi:uncharacterized membrane protein HdeD (DUF308 family)
MLLSAIDLFAGISITASGFFMTFGFVRYLGYICIIKGIASLIGSLASRYYFDWMGIIDVIAGIVILLMKSGVSYSFFHIFGIVVIVKGIYSFARSGLGI